MAYTATDLYALAWPRARLGEAIDLVAHRAKLVFKSVEIVPSLPDHIFADEATVDQWVEMLAIQLGIEIEPTTSSFIDFVVMLRAAAPAILSLPPLHDDEQASGFLVLLPRRRSRGRVAVLSPDLKVRLMSPTFIRDVMCRPWVAPWLEVTEQVLNVAGVPERARSRAQTVMIQEQLRSVQIRCGWVLKLSPSANLSRQTTEGRVWSPLIGVLGANIVQQVLVLAAWWVIGQGALSGNLDWAWLWAWALLLLTAIPFELLIGQLSSRFSTRLGGVFKQRLLYGALQFDPDEMRHQGHGQFLGRVIDSEAVELLALGGGLTALIAVVQLGIASWVMTKGVGGWNHAVLLIAWLGMILFFAWCDYKSSCHWFESYRDMTNDLVERMIGHRTRLAQEVSQNWHTDEDRALTRYLTVSRRFDRTSVWLAILPNAWLLVSLMSIAHTFVATTEIRADLTLSIGGILLAYQALSEIVGGLQSLVQMATAWQQVLPVFAAAMREEKSPSAFLPITTSSTTTEQALLLAKDLNFRYREQGRWVLKNCDLRINKGDRLLLEGPSGGGKTTLAAILAGLRIPESGVLLMRGYDWQSLGYTAWRKLVTIAPQFHENHIFTETFGFNVLMGRHWPPTTEDLEEAEQLCRELGLDDLLDRMPSGMQQMIGESGWQLSHGERSRVFIARALLQNADLLILDESFGALDPENLYLALRCALNHASTLLVIAHP